MAGIPLPKSPNTDVQRLQDAAQKQLKDVQKSPIVSGLHLDGIALKAGQANRVNHGLGRKPQGCKPVSLNAQATVWNDPFDDKVLTLYTSADVTASFWVY